MPIRPREHLHERACLAQAMISAIENWRDVEGITDLEFRFAMQDNDALRAADDNLATGSSTCICADDPEPPFDPNTPWDTMTCDVCGQTHRTVMKTGITKGADPTEWYRLDCGHTVI